MLTDGGPRPLRGRGEQLRAVARGLAAPGAVLVLGGRGSGRSALLAAVLRERAERGDVLLHAVATRRVQQD
ncbi:hypothetical protein GTQ99_03110, partial [Kineococcus sp. T13]|uniref:hypothetical protein n=1 Tax=Kineococcus vitellinus TaxID=2696565 RepID=UPI00196A415F